MYIHRPRLASAQLVGPEDGRLAEAQPLLQVVWGRFTTPLSKSTPTSPEQAPCRLRMSENDVENDVARWPTSGADTRRRGDQAAPTTRPARACQPGPRRGCHGQGRPTRPEKHGPGSRAPAAGCPGHQSSARDMISSVPSPRRRRAAPPAM